MNEPLARGMIVWVWLDPTVGREYAGHRPAIVIASDGYLATIDQLVIVLPITTVDRGWPNHIKVSPDRLLAEPSWVVTEQPRTISRDRITKTSSVVSSDCMRDIDSWLDIFIKP